MTEAKRDSTDTAREIERLTEAHRAVVIHGRTNPECLFCSVSDIALRLAGHTEDMKNSIANVRGDAVASLIEANATLIGRVSHFEQENARLKDDMENADLLNDSMHRENDQLKATIQQWEAEVLLMEEEKNRLKAEVERLKYRLLGLGVKIEPEVTEAMKENRE